MSSRSRRLAIAGLGLVGAAIALYMLAYEEGWTQSIVCPLFAGGCAAVARSVHARHFGVPNAAVGLAAYAGIATLALLGLRTQMRTGPQRMLRAVSGAAVLAGVFLIWEQAVRVRAFCFWCLTSAAVSLAVFVLALRNGAAPRESGSTSAPSGTR